MNVTVSPDALEDAWLAFMISSAAAKLAMPPLELDGYLTGVAVSPEMIRPRLWLRRACRRLLRRDLRRTRFHFVNAPPVQLIKPAPLQV